MPVTEKRGRRISAIFAESTYKALEDIAARKGATMAEVLRDAIALEKWVQDTRDEGGRILIERNGKVQELLLR